MRAYDFWEETGTVESGPYPIASLSLRPSNKATANDLQMMFPSGMPIEQQLAVADRVLAGVQRWRDSIAGAADRQRTAVAELAAAREEIARLKAEAADDPARCLEAHPFSPRDGWRMICSSCDHDKNATCHQGERGGAS